ncbi:ribosomal protein S12 methylthiotransferase accessory factor [Kribbella sp. VKM Ac-2571]|uniref:YcaO-like family protein n=1 Tax=Kribbella sp. VKM Ac-2571 TaxID=2512222 RepID=UPI00105BA223|nr:YcaO-like family protein [Kribbella sp. VKM Ac-2571]TDO60866.1 ribosomal protein S12 methylthiotransferase accessory factor [Kribbella sp. VKM Ac-2571]
MAHSRAQAERSADLEAAVRHGYAEAARLGLRFTPQFIASDQFGVTFLDVHDPDGNQVCTGAGKGVGMQCEASALFEALEHFQLATATRYETDSLQLFPAPDMVQQDALALEHHLHRLARDCADSQLACVRFGEIHGDAEMWYPAVFANPVFSERPAAGDTQDKYWAYVKYASTTGSASGMELDDALLHGLLECIERDAISLALLSLATDQAPTDQSSPGVSIAIVDPRSLPEDLATLRRQIAELDGTDPLLLRITTDLGVPTYFALSGGHDRVGKFGGGSSLSSHYAAERALSELLQILYITEWKDLQPSRIERGEIFAPWPVLDRIYHLDLPFEKLPTVPLDAEHLDHDVAVGSSWEQLMQLTRILHGAGLTAYHREWTGSLQGIAVTTVVVPGLERFMCPVMLGALAMPMARGVGLLESVHV